MGEPLDDVTYLARSENRVAILRALDERPRDRRDLEAAIGVSPSTLSRVLGELEEERDWIHRKGDAYETTAAGSIVLERLLPLLETTRALQTLGDGLEYLPVEEMELDLRHFHDAELLKSTEFDPIAPFGYGVDRLRESTTARSVGRTVPPPYVRAIHEAVQAGDLALEIVLDDAYLDTVEGSELAPLWRELAATADVRRYGEFTPYSLIVLDEVVHIWLCSGEGDTAGLLETENPTVREWAESVVDRYLAAAEPLATAPQA